ncbi:hypothetical protein FRB91_005781 [Serendipita sp. 411]|nr:hypothetical protein FRB91_005781 [Serendipita sp. 411]
MGLGHLVTTRWSPSISSYDGLRLSGYPIRKSFDVCLLDDSFPYMDTRIWASCFAKGTRRSWDERKFSIAVTLHWWRRPVAALTHSSSRLKSPPAWHSALESTSSPSPRNLVYLRQIKMANNESLYHKRLIVCCDGTGQSSSHEEGSVPTNITRIARGLKTSVPGIPADPDKGVEAQAEIPQVVLYQTGIGTEGPGLTGISEGLTSAFGLNLDVHVLEAYTFFANNYEDGDRLFLFGFSRGAFTARAVASLICNAGLLKKDSLQYLPMIYKEYKSRLNPQPDDEDFETWMEKRKNTWFPGVHTDVGGGYERAYRDISDLTFAWMVDRCSGQLDFEPIEVLHEQLLKPSFHPKDPEDPIGALKNVSKPSEWGLSKEHDEFHTLKFRLAGAINRTPGQYFLNTEIDKGNVKYTTNEYMHPSVRMRLLEKKDGGWKPPSLGGFKFEKGQNEHEYQWRAEVDLVDGKKETVIIPEEPVPWEGSFEGRLLTAYARRVLADETRALALQVPK